MRRTKRIYLKDGNFFINDRPFFLFSGEIHYFRTPHKKWKTYLKRAKEANLNTISTYIPWRWHEYREGKFDFSGKTQPERDLLSFLNLAYQAGLFVILRPGPISHAELKDDGLPAWLIDNYPQIRLKKPDGSLYRGSMISLLHPVYKKFVRRWYEEVLPIIASWQITRGKNVILVQLDNEINMINWLIKRADASKTTKKLYQTFLKKKYKTTEKLNATYKADFRDFSKVNYPILKYNDSPGVRYWDWACFWREFYAAYYEFLAKLAVNNGIQVPFVANIAHFADIDTLGRGIYSPTTSSMFKNFTKNIDNLVFGGAYQMRHLNYENFHDVAVTTEVVKMLSCKKSPAICAELQTGILFDRPVLYPSDVELNILTSSAHGLNGLNCYMFTSGHNKEDMGALGTRHNWQAAVDIDADKRPHYEPIKKWGKVFKLFGPALACCKKETDISVGLYTPYYMTEFLKGSFVKKLENQRNKFFFDGICRLLEIAGYSFDIIDIQSSLLTNKRNLFVFSLDFMDLNTQKKLVEFVEKGGNLIIGPNLPFKDLKSKKCTYLQDRFNLYPKESKDSYVLDKKDYLYVEKPIRIFYTKAKGLIKTESKNKTAVFKKVKKGSVIIYGFGLTHLFDYHVDIMGNFLSQLKIKQAVKKENKDIQTVLRIKNTNGFLFVINYHELNKKAAFNIRLPKTKKSIRIPSRGYFTLSARGGRILPLNYKVSDRLEIIKTTAQILDINKSKDKIKFKLGVTPHTHEEISLRISKPESIVIDNEKFALGKKRKTHTFGFEPKSCLSYIEITFKVN